MLRAGQHGAGLVDVGFVEAVLAFKSGQAFLVFFQQQTRTQFGYLALQFIMCGADLLQCLRTGGGVFHQGRLPDFAANHQIVSQGRLGVGSAQHFCFVHTLQVMGDALLHHQIRHARGDDKGQQHRITQAQFGEQRAPFQQIHQEFHGFISVGWGRWLAIC